MNEESVYVQFLGCTVAIESDDPSLLDWYRRRFRYMSAEDRGSPVEVLRISKSKGGKHTVDHESTGESRQGPAGEMIRDLEYSVVDAMIAAHPKLFWLHSGAAAFENKAIVVAGVTGRGKSTLIAHLIHADWLFLSDDTVALDLDSGVVYPFPRAPVARRPVSSRVPEELIYELEKEEVPVKEEGIATAPIPLAAVVFPFFDFEGETKLNVYPKGPAATDLLRNCFSFSARGAEALGQLHDLVSHLPTLRVTYQKGENAAALVIKARESDFEIQ